MNLVERITAAIHHAGAITGYNPTTDPIVLGLSGGPDSLALFHALHHQIPPSKLIVAHLDHRLRPPSADEARFVARLADHYSVRCHLKTVDVAALAGSTGISIEEAGRLARYHFLAEIARQEQANLVATGHHAGDQVETVLMHFLRGAGLSGLRGMERLAPLPGAADIWLWRPLLDVPRADIDTYCRENDLDPVIDLSNTDPTYYRNRLRHELLPILETYNPTIQLRLFEMAEVLAAEEAILGEWTESIWGPIATVRPGEIRLRREAWQAQPLAMRRRLIRRAVAELRPTLRDVGFRTVEMARQVAETGKAGARAMLPGGLQLIIDYDDLLFTPVAASLVDAFPQLTTSAAVPLPVPGSIELANHHRLTAERVSGPDLEQIRHNQDPWQAYIAVPDDPQGLVVRPRQPGERMRPLGLAGETKLKEVMINRKIPARARAMWPVVAGDSHAFWVVGHVLDERAQVTPDSQEVIRVSIQFAPS